MKTNKEVFLILKGRETGKIQIKEEYSLNLQTAKKAYNKAYIVIMACYMKDRFDRICTLNTRKDYEEIEYAFEIFEETKMQYDEFFQAEGKAISEFESEIIYPTKEADSNSVNANDTNIPATTKTEEPKEEPKKEAEAEEEAEAKEEPVYISDSESAKVWDELWNKEGKKNIVNILKKSLIIPEGSDISIFGYYLAIYYVSKESKIKVKWINRYEMGNIIHNVSEARKEIRTYYGNPIAIIPAEKLPMFMLKNETILDETYAPFGSVNSELYWNIRDKMKDLVRFNPSAQWIEDEYKKAFHNNNEARKNSKKESHKEPEATDEPETVIPETEYNPVPQLASEPETESALSTNIIDCPKEGAKIVIVGDNSVNPDIMNLVMASLGDTIRDKYNLIAQTLGHEQLEKVKVF